MALLKVSINGNKTSITFQAHVRNPFNPKHTIHFPRGLDKTYNTIMFAYGTQHLGYSKISKSVNLCYSIVGKCFSTSNAKLTTTLHI